MSADRDRADAGAELGSVLVDVVAAIDGRDPGDLRAQLDMAAAKRLNRRVQGRRQRRLARLQREVNHR